MIYKMRSTQSTLFFLPLQVTSITRFPLYILWGVEMERAWGRGFRNEKEKLRSYSVRGEKKSGRFSEGMSILFNKTEITYLDVHKQRQSIHEEWIQF